MALDIKSPDGNIRVNVDVNNVGTPYYSVSYGDKAVINDSKLGFNLLDLGSLADDFEIIGSGTESIDETWSPVWGEESEIRNNYN